MKMKTFSIKCILLIYLTFTICCKCQSNSPGVSSSWAKLQISPDTLNSMEYGNFLIEIYEHAHNHKATTTSSQKKYFYSPLALLDHKSAVCRYNRVTKKPEMRFRIEMWNDMVQNEVVKHLNEIVSQEIKSNQVRVIPLEKVILTSNVPTEDYSLSPDWTNYDKSKTIWFHLSFYDQQICDELTGEIQSDPTQFHHLKLLYSLSSQTSQTKQTTISIDSVTSGSMVSKFLQKFGDKNEIFLTANDEKKMLAETVTNIKMETLDDSEVASPDTENQILNILKDLLVTSRETIKDQSDKMWDSVFWNEDNYRPDRTTKTLNEIHKKLDGETQKKLTDMFQKAERQSEIKEISTSSNKDAEKRREEQIRRENQSKDAKENENRRSEATEQEQFDRNLNSDEKSLNSKIVAGLKLGFDGFAVGGFSIGGSGKVSANVGFENSNAHNTQQENEKRENEKKNSDEQNRNLENKERMQHNYDANSWTDVDRISSTISGKLTNDSDNSRRVEISKEDVEKLLQESRNHVQWDGEKFVPKPMQLGRINLGTFRDSQSFKDRNVRVRYTNAELSAPIKFMEHAELTVTDEWNNLKDELKATAKLLNTTVKDLEKTSGELSSVKSDLAAAVMKLGEMNNEWTNKLKATSQLLNTTVKNLGEMNNELINVKRDLTHTKNALLGTKQELNITQIELGKTKSNLRKNFDDLSKTLNGNENELVKLQIKTGNLSIELKTTSMRLGHDFKENEENLRKELRATLINVETTISNLNATRTELVNAKSDVADLKTKLNETSNSLETATRNLASTMTELNSTKSAVADLTKMLNARTKEIVDIGRMPTSCSDLQRMGHKLSGFFSVKGSKQMKMIYCDFFPNQNDLQKRIGYVDVKSVPVHFYVLSYSSFTTKSTPITFDLVRVNEGNAMNMTSGIFTAPRTGIYFFSFTGLAQFPESSSGWLSSSPSRVWLGVKLYLNGNYIGRGWVEESNTVAGQNSPLTLQSTLKLKKDDQVWVEIDDISSGSYLLDYYFTHFTGFMLEEEIVASL